MHVNNDACFPYYAATLLYNVSANNLIKSIYPKADAVFFDIPPNQFDKKYIHGVKRSEAKLNGDVYLKEKERIKSHIDNIFYEGPICFKKILSSEANTPMKSWETVISGKRPLGQFSVDTLYSPVLHTLSELPDIGIKIYPKENNDFLYMIVIYNKKFTQCNEFVERYMHLYNKKHKIMEELKGSHELRVIKSELIVAKELGEIFYYSDESINEYLSNLKRNLLEKS